MLPRTNGTCPYKKLINRFSFGTDKNSQNESGEQIFLKTTEDTIEKPYVVEMPPDICPAIGHKGLGKNQQIADPAQIDIDEDEEERPIAGGCPVVGKLKINS